MHGSSVGLSAGEGWLIIWKGVAYHLERGGTQLHVWWGLGKLEKGAATELNAQVSVIVPSLIEGEIMAC